MNFDQWMEVKDSDIWKLGDSMDISMTNNHILPSLILSYSCMDPCLKSCFTYCAIFPKGHQIVKNDLIYQWISLGFIKPTKLLSVMDLCKKYIMQLKGLSFLEELPKTSEAYSEKDTIFTMHDVVHDLAISILGNQILDPSKQGNTWGSSCQYALLADCSKPLESCLTFQERLIALRFLHCRSTELNGAAFTPATSLRVLDLSECYIQKLPDSIGELKQLRYLKTPGVGDKMFPECITKLSQLIYLNLQGSSNISALPVSIGEMKDLMHLDLSGCRKIRRLPGSFISLEKLLHLDFSHCSLILGESEPLRSLGQLEHLSLSRCTISGDLAKALCGITELQYLDLSQVFCWGNLCRGIQVLERFTKLRYLDVRGVLDSNGVGGAETENFTEIISMLSSLEYLNLGWNRSLYSIPESIGNLWKLHTLDLSYCINLERLPAAISRTDKLKFVHVTHCKRLDKSILALYKNVAMLPYFVVHAGDSESSSNLCQVEYENPTELEISQLENEKSAGEAQRLKLVEKQRIEVLGLVWTQDAMRFIVEDKDVLEQLVPPCSVREIRLEGYNSVDFPSWMMNFATYVPQLVDVTLEGMPNCSSLPPLGQLPNLHKLRIRRMNSIRKIGQDLYGGFKKRAFPRLERFELQEMECLEEWNKELVFPNLHNLIIADCPMLRFISLALGKNMSIVRSGQFIPSSWKCSAEFDAVTSSAAITWLCIEHCETPLHQWSLLRHFPYLRELHIEDCSDLTCSSTDFLCCVPSLETLAIKNCKSIAELPERLGDLSTLKNVKISDCDGVKVLPESIQQLTCLQCLKIYGCPQLVQWCKSEENTMKLAHIKEVILDFQKLSVISIPESDREVETKLEKLQDIDMVQKDLSFQLIREITDDFSKERILGEGTFGVVYRGLTKNGQDVAVKKLKPCTDLDSEQFRNEMDTLMKLNHQNIVKVLGYCYETKKITLDGSKVFVDEIHTAMSFEYLHNGNLQKHLSDESCEVKLDWHVRFKIIKGICAGLMYMHKDLQEPIYHFDLKPDNILLDTGMVPKIVDFGLSKIFGRDKARTTHNPHGTLGYQPPEYIYGGEISGKFDIFSLGAIMIRILSGPMRYPERWDNMSSYEFIDQVRENWRNKLQETCSDSLLEAYCRQVGVCSQIALDCLDEDSQIRPDIVKITEKLNEIEV